MRESLLWGCQIDEYRRMFALQDKDLEGNLLECGRGISALNANLHALGKSITSCNSLFSLDYSNIKAASALRFNAMLHDLTVEPEQYDFNNSQGLDAWTKNRQSGMELFLKDYISDNAKSRYIPMETKLPFNDFSMDLALSAYQLFTQEIEDSLAFHLSALQELARVAKEVRVFPLLDAKGQPSALLGPVLLGLQRANYGVEIREVDDRLQRRGHAMLRIWANTCSVGV